MSDASQVHVALPAFVRVALDALLERVSAALGDDLVGMILYGAAARGDVRPHETDIDVLLVLRDVGVKNLDAIADALQAARYAARVETTILAEDEIDPSRGAFPLFYDDVRRHHVVLAGRDPFDPSPVDHAHERRRIEQVLRVTLVRLRRAVTDALGAREAMGGAVLRRLARVELALRSFARLVGIEGTEPRILLEELGRRYAVDVGALADPRQAPEEAYEALVALLTAILHELRTDDEARVLPVASIAPADAGS